MLMGQQKCDGGAAADASGGGGGGDAGAAATVGDFGLLGPLRAAGDPPSRGDEAASSPRLLRRKSALMARGAAAQSEIRPLFGAPRAFTMADDAADAGKEYPEFPGEKLSKRCVPARVPAARGAPVFDVHAAASTSAALRLLRRRRLTPPRLPKRRATATHAPNVGASAPRLARHCHASPARWRERSPRPRPRRSRARAWHAGGQGSSCAREEGGERRGG